MAQDIVQIINKVSQGGTLTPPSSGIIEFNVNNGNRLILLEPASKNFNVRFTNLNLTSTKFITCSLTYTNLSKAYMPVAFFINTSSHIPDYVSQPRSQPSNRIIEYTLQFYLSPTGIKSFCTIRNYAPGTGGQALSLR